MSLLHTSSANAESAAVSGIVPTKRTQLTSQIVNLIRSGEINPGEQIPSERKLSDQFEVSRPSIREVLVTLADMGLLVGQTNARPQVAASGNGVLERPFEYLFLVEKPDQTALHELREMFEINAAVRAVSRRDDTHLARLTSSVEIMEHSAHHEPAYLAAHRDFHETLMTAADNRMMLLVYLGMMQARRAYFVEREDNLQKTKAWRPDNRPHRDLLDALIRRDVDAARIAIQRDMSKAWDYLQTYLASDPKQNETLTVDQPSPDLEVQ